jgi:hypothetical protein
MTIICKPDNMINGNFYPACPGARLHMLIHGFVNEEGTKPADEQDLQAFPDASQALLSGIA